MAQAGPTIEAPSGSRERLSRLIARAAEPLPDIVHAEFARMFDRFGDARVVLLGESTQGTSEFYRARAAITRWLVERRGFTIVALESDASDGVLFDAYVRGRDPPRGGVDPANRFPPWRWRNAEFLDFLDGLRAHNAGRVDGPKARVFGLDLYDLAGSMRAAVDYLDRIDPSAAQVARRRFGGPTPWADEPAAQGAAPLTAAYVRHEAAVAAILSGALRRRMTRMCDDGLLTLDQASRLNLEAKAHYRALYYGGSESWNRRGAHMLETLDAVLAGQGANAKAVVWAHNAHAGDAQATETGMIREDRNLGRLCRQVWGREAVLMGFGTHSGAVACASDGDGGVEIKRLSPAAPGSFESLAHGAGVSRGLLDLRPDRHDDLRGALTEPRLERFVGAVYQPQTERRSHYADCRLAQQFDAWVWFDDTSAVTPLPIPVRTAGDEGAEAAPWPFGP